MSNLVLATAKQLAPGALLFEEGFESPVVPGYLQGVPTVGWLRSSNGFGADRIGLNNASSGDWVSPGPADEQGVDPNYTNTGAITAESVIGPININTVTYRFTITVAYDKFLSGKLYGAASGAYDVRLCAFEPGFPATGLGSRSDFVGVGAIQKARAFVSLTGSVASDDLVHTFVGEYTTDPVNDIGRKGYDLAIAIIGATASAIITSVKVEQINGARRVNWAPDKIATAAWYDAADETTIDDTTTPGQVEQWSDKSGNANHLIQPTPTVQPITGTRTINGLNTLDWQALSPQTQMPLSSIITDNPPLYCFIVMETDSDATNSVVYDSTTSRYTQLGLFQDKFYMRLGADEVGGIDFTGAAGSGISAGTPGILEYWVGSDNEAYVAKNGGTPVSAGTWSAVDFEISRLGRNGADNLDGKLGEVIIMLTEPTLADRQRIEGYLAHKWGLTANLPDDHPYKDAAPTVLWTPADIDTAAWYDASATSTVTEAGGSVSQWSDKSGNARHVSQAVPTSQPQIGSKFINGLNTVYSEFPRKLVGSLPFSSSGGFEVVFVGAWYNPLLAYEAFWQLSNSGGQAFAYTKVNGLKAINFRMENDAGTNQQVFGSATLEATPMIVSCSYDETNVKGYLNGNAAGTTGTVTPPFTVDTIELGAFADANTLTAIGEFIMVPVSDTVTRQKAEGYLAHKWGLQAKLPSNHPYKIDPPHI